MNKIKKIQTRYVVCENHTIEYFLERKRVKNINLRVKSDRTVHVSASSRVSADYIDEFVKQKYKFITDVRKKYDQKNQVEANKVIMQLKDGEKYSILGKNRILKISSVDKRCDEGIFFDINSEYIYLKVINIEDLNHKQNIFEKWKKQFSMEILKKVVDDTYYLFSRYNVPYPELKIRTMKTMWGSCRPQRKIITLNQRLIETPYKCISYVVIHEYAHFVYPDHSALFWNVVSEYVPDYKIIKKELWKYE